MNDFKDRKDMFGISKLPDDWDKLPIPADSFKKFIVSIHVPARCKTHDLDLGEAVIRDIEVKMPLCPKCAEEKATNTDFILGSVQYSPAIPYFPVSEIPLNDDLEDLDERFNATRKREYAEKREAKTDRKP